jgi:hypothetical protein
MSSTIGANSAAHKSHCRSEESVSDREGELAWRERVLDEKEHELNRIPAQESVEGSDCTKVGKAERVLE